MGKEVDTTQDRRSDALEEIITGIPNWVIRYGNIAVLIIVSILLLASYLIKYPEKVVSEVTITTMDPPQKIVTQISGIVDSVFVQNDDMVTTNDPIALFENSANYYDVKYLENMISEFHLGQDDLWFSESRSPELLLGELENPFSEFENAYIKYDLLKQYNGQAIRSVATIKNVAERKRKLSSLKEQYGLNSKELELLKLDVERSEQLFKKGVISRREYEKKEIDYVRAEQLAKNILLDISEVKYEMIQSEQNVQLTSIEKIRVKGNVEKKVLQKLHKLKVSIRDWKRKFLLKSARRGRVTFLRDLKKNDYVQEKQLVVSVVPTIDLKPVAKLKTSSTNSGKIEIGQQVHIRLENYSYIEYGMLIGRVKAMSLVPDADNLYFIDVELPNELITTYNKQLDFKYELSGQAEIITQDARLIERFLQQLKSLVKN